MIKKRNSKRLVEINHAIIGCGHIAPSHIYGCESNNVTVTSCFDIDLNKAKKFAQVNKIKSVANSFEEILNNKSIDSLSICTDHKSHAQLTIKALKSKKNVVVEKPMALSVEDGEKMISTAKENKKVLSVISQHRYNQVIIEIKKVFDGNIFGKNTIVNATLNCQKKEAYYQGSDWKGTLEKEGGSTLINQAIHTLDIVLWIKGVPIDVRSYYSTLKFKKLIETEDTLASIMKFKDKSLGLFSSTNTSVNIWDSKVEMVGTKGLLTFSVDYPVKILHLVHENKKTEESLRTTLEFYTDKFEKAPPVGYYGTKHKDQMANFFNVICGKSKKLFMEPEEALKTLSVVLRLYKNSH